MSNLQTVLNSIKSQKDTLLIPENLRKDITLLGITGTLEELITPEDYAEALQLTEDILGVIGQQTADTVGPVLNDILGTSDITEIGGTQDQVDAVFDDILGEIN